ncbi:hypothetical protein D3C76_1326250 [compost metagenome]
MGIRKMGLAEQNEVSVGSIPRHLQIAQPLGISRNYHRTFPVVEAASHGLIRLAGTDSEVQIGSF